MKRAASLSLAVLLASCQGSIGSTPPVSAPAIPAANQAGQVPGVGGPGASLAKTSEATVRYSGDMASLPFPVTEGYGLQIILTPSSSPSPSASASAHASGSASASGVASASASASAAPSASASASASAVASPSASAKGKKPKGPPVTVKLSVYPDLVQVAPTPDIDADASPAPTPLADRPAILRGYFKSPVSFVLSSLDAFRFTVPLNEISGKRGFTIALFAVPDKNQIANSLFGSHKDTSTRIAYTTAAIVETDGTIHAGTQSGPLSISAGQGYTAVLYGDLRAVAPAAPVAAPAGTGSSFGSPSALPFGASPPAGVPYGSTAMPIITPTPGGIRSN